MTRRRKPHVPTNPLSDNNGSIEPRYYHYSNEEAVVVTAQTHGIIHNQVTDEVVDDFLERITARNEYLA
jgi:hypothetical protein